ncbi:AzlC family ABC transporter permease [Haloterrigena salinisoli]|uniref:AzlC family ABC transporter permease n=1 Tax=Haloterrigena salinisoli TaxID=3132747 RepID=UPI0030D3DFE6
MSTGSADSAHQSEEPEGPTVEFSLSGVRDGYIECVPIALGVAGYGIVFGVLSRQAGLSVAEAAFMSATVLAGAAQLIAIKLWETPIPILTVIGTTFIVNLRYVLMGAALRPWFSQLSPLKAYGSVFFTADENWALTMGKLKSGSHQGAYLLGSGLAIWSFWIVATVLGAIAGGVIGEPAQYGLDFVLTAVFLAIAVGLWEGKSSFLPWITAFSIAVLGAHFLPGRWYILFGGVAGSLVEVIRFDE